MQVRNFNKLLITPIRINANFILQAENRSEVRLPGSCREGIVRNRVGLVGEYPSRCLAADRTTLRLDNICQAVLFLPDTNAIDGTIIKGSAGLRMEGFKSIQLISENCN